MNKPVECAGCGLYQSGTGWVPDELHVGAKITIVAQNPGASEEEQGRPLVGWSGQTVDLSLAKYGIKREDANYCNVLKCRYQQSDDLPQGKLLSSAVEHCTHAYLFPTLKHLDSNLYVLLGDLALNRLTGKHGIEAWRGSVFLQDLGPLAGKKVLPTIHPSYLNRDPSLRSASKSDFARIAREWRSKLPTIIYADNFRIAVTASEFCETLRALDGKRLVLDVETNYAKPINAKLKVIGVAWSKMDAMNYFCNEVSDARVLEAIQRHAGEWITATPFDYGVLTRRSVNFEWGRCHDLTLLHSRFDIELPHTLEFIASMWTDRVTWKWMSSLDPGLYNCLDCAGEWEAFDRLLRHCHAYDRGVVANYERDRAMIPVAVALHLNGLPLDLAAFEEEKEYYRSHREELQHAIAESFKSPIQDDGESSVPPVCVRHPRYTGRTPVPLRKRDLSPCFDCQGVYDAARRARPLNLRSRLQVRAKLGEQGILVPTRKDGKFSLDKGAVDKLIEKYHDARLIKFKEFTELDTIMKLYFKEARAAKETGRVHATFGMHAAKHRWNCTEPNMQQQLKPDEEE